jgi:curved DNA-binding protein CbpA
MARVAKAAELLGDPETRALYDAGVADLDGKDSGFESGAQKERVGGKSA